MRTLPCARKCISSCCCKFATAFAHGPNEASCLAHMRISRRDRKVALPGPIQSHPARPLTFHSSYLAWKCCAAPLHLAVSEIDVEHGRRGHRNCAFEASSQSNTNFNQCMCEHVANFCQLALLKATFTRSGCFKNMMLICSRPFAGEILNITLPASHNHSALIVELKSLFISQRNQQHSTSLIPSRAIKRLLSHSIFTSTRCNE